jgi:hypothetical protein
MNLLLAAANTSGLVNLLWMLLWAIVIIAVIGGVIWAIGKYIHPIPPPILLVIAAILLVVFLIWIIEYLPRP